MSVLFHVTKYARISPIMTLLQAANVLAHGFFTFLGAVKSRSERVKNGSIFCRGIIKKCCHSKSEMFHSSLERILTPCERVFQSIGVNVFVTVEARQIHFSVSRENEPDDSEW